MNVRRVLHPTDFSPGALPAFDRAVVLAEHFGAELHLIHVTETFGDDPLRGVFDVRLDEETFYHDQWAKADQQMQDLADRVQQKGVELRRVHSRGRKPAPVILDYARDQQADLIVMGTHGRRGFRRMFAGSVAMEVVRKADVPVLTVGPHVRGDDFFDRILVPVDYSEHARTALGLAKELAASFQSGLTALHVIEKPNVPAFYETNLEMFFGSVENLREEASAELVRLSEEAGHPEVPMEYEVRIGHVVDEVLKTARSTGAGMIVLSTHGTTGMPRFFLGSVSERIIRSADVPVLRLRTIKTIADDAAVVGASRATKSS